MYEFVQNVVHILINPINDRKCHQNSVTKTKRFGLQSLVVPSLPVSTILPSFHHQNGNGHEMIHSEGNTIWYTLPSLNGPLSTILPLAMGFADFFSIKLPQDLWSGPSSKALSPGSLQALARCPSRIRHLAKRLNLGWRLGQYL